MRYFFLFLLFFVFLSIHNCSAQSTDNITWSSIQLLKNINDQSSYAIKPIIRHHQDVSTYQNSSLDFSYRRKIGKGWYLQGLTRYWFMPDATDRYFLWFDVGYSKDIKKSKLTTFFRYHQAFDIKDRIDPDFLRWKANWTFPSLGAVAPVLGYEIFFRLNSINNVDRVRYEPGIKWRISKTLELSTVYRRENFQNESPKRKFNVGVINLVVKI